MQYTLKNINELRVADLKTVMRPAAAVRLIQGQSERGGNSNITNLTDFNVGTNKKSASQNGFNQLSQNVETGKVVVVQSNPMDEDSVLSSVGRLSTNLPETLSLKVKELLVIVRSSSINRTIPYELVSKEAAISNLAAEQQARAKAQHKPVVDPSASRVNNPKVNMANAVTTRTTNPYAPDAKQVLYYEINVELAGQWPMNSASLFLEKTDEQDRAAARPRADRKVAHRSVSRFRNIDNEPRNLYLNIPDKNRSTPIQLLLAENIVPVEKDTEMDEWDNVLVPVRPLAYLSEDKDKTNAAELKGGYLYLFWKGELWRELKVTERSYYQDVNLEKYRNLAAQQNSDNNELRPAEGSPLPDLWIPYKLNGEVQSGATGVKLLFWPTQLTTDQIDNYEATPADLDKYATELDGLSAYSQSQAFSDDQHISDMLSTSLIPVTEDDMPWLGNATSLFGRLQNSNIAAAYLDGQNKGIRFKFEVGMEDSENGPMPEYVAHLVNNESQWQQSQLVTAVKDSNGTWRECVFYGLPKEGLYSLYVVNPDSSYEREVIFSEVNYETLITPPQADGDIVAVEEPPELDESEFVPENFWNDYHDLVTQW